MKHAIEVVLVGILAVGCSTETSSGSACDPGLSQRCYGPGACEGGQECLPNGTAWSACDCGTSENGATTPTVFENDCGVYMVSDLTTTGSSAADTVNAFFEDAASILGDIGSELEPTEEPEIGILRNPDSDIYGFTQFRYQQMRSGLKVYGATVKLLVAEEDGFPLKLVDSTALSLGDFQPSYDAADVTAQNATDVLDDVETDLDLVAVAEDATGASDLVLGKRELVVWAGTKNECVAPELAVAYEVASQSGLTLSRFVVLVENQRVATRRDLVASATVTVQGTASSVATPVSDTICDPIADSTARLKLATVSLAAPQASVPNTARTDENGRYTLSGPWQAGSTVRANLDGAFVTVKSAAGATFDSGDLPDASAQLFASENAPANNETLNVDLFVPTAGDDQTPNDERAAAANAYVHVTEAAKWAQSRGATIPLGPILAEVDHSTDSLRAQASILQVNPDGIGCPGAYSHPSRTLFFCSATNTASHTALPDLIYHEYAHQLVFRAHPTLNTSNAYDEGMADFVAASVAVFESEREDLRMCGYRNHGTETLSQSGLRPPDPATCKFTAKHDDCCKATSDFPDRRYSCGTVLAATLWDLRAAVDPETAERYALALIREWAPPATDGPNPLGTKESLPMALLEIDRQAHAEKNGLLHRRYHAPERHRMPPGSSPRAHRLVLHQFRQSRPARGPEAAKPLGPV